MSIADTVKVKVEEGGIIYTVEVSPDGSKIWRLNGLLHREDGPAKEYAEGDKKWYLKGQRHREDGPAKEYADGTKCWYLKGTRHRVDGPAVEWADGTKKWFLKGVSMPFTQFLRESPLALWIKSDPRQAIKYASHEHLGELASRALAGGLYTDAQKEALAGLNVRPA